MDCSPAVSPAAAVALLKEGDAAQARCRKVLPHSWAAMLKAEHDVAWALKPVLERHLQRSPNAWQAALQQEAQGKAKQRVRQVQARAGLREDAPPCCDGCGVAGQELKWCACRLKRYCSKECQRRDFPAHKAECKKARGVA